MSELAQGLTQKGFQVTVLTAMPNYPKGKIYAGYWGLLKIEQQDKVKVVRTIIFPTQKASLVPRLLNYFSFVFSSLFIGIWFTGRADYILTESPPLFLGISGYLISRLKRARWIFNVSDLWPESAVRLGAVSDGLALKMSEKLEAFCYRKAWLVSGQSKSILQNIEERFPKVRTYHLSNGVDKDLFSPVLQNDELRKQLAPEKEVILFYGGLHGLAQGLEQILFAAEKINQTMNKRVQFVFVGDGPQKQELIELASSLNLRNIKFLDPVEKKAMPALVALADICLIPLKIYLPGAVPSKLYEAMASEKPVILIAEGEAAEIVSSAVAGVVVHPGDIDGLANAIVRLIDNPDEAKAMGKAGRKAVELYYDRRNIVDGFAEFLRGAV